MKQKRFRERTRCLNLLSIREHSKNNLPNTLRQISNLTQDMPKLMVYYFLNDP